GGTGRRSCLSWPPGLSSPRQSLLPHDRVAGLNRAGRGAADAGGAAADGDLLHGLEVDERLVVVGDRADFGGAGRREGALRLEGEEGVADARREFLFLGRQLLFGELARGARRFDALLVRLDLARDVAHLRGDLHLQVLQLNARLLILQLRALEIRLRDARAERVADLQA